jgi:hypothetical protein
MKLLLSLPALTSLHLQADSLAALLLSLTRVQDVALVLSRLGNKAMARVLYTFLKADADKVGGRHSVHAALQ